MKSLPSRVLKAVSAFENWPYYFLDSLKLLKNEYVLKVRSTDHVSYVVRPKTADRGIVNEVWVDQIYTPEGFDVGEDDVVVDVGAHIGVFSVFAAKKARKGRVYAFEPLPENFRLLKENIKRNNASNIVAANTALSSKKGERKFYVDPENSGGHSFYPAEKSKEITVRTDTLENFLADNKVTRIDFLKMDCEGAEYDILFSLPRKALGKIGKISMEYHDIGEGKNGKSMLDFLESNGFRATIRENGEIGLIHAVRRGTKQ